MNFGMRFFVAAQYAPVLAGMPQVSVGAKSANPKPNALKQAKQKKDKHLEGQGALEEIEADLVDQGEDLPSSDIDFEAGARDPPADAPQTGGVPVVAGAAGGTSPTPETRYPKSGTWIPGRNAPPPATKHPPAALPNACEQEWGGNKRERREERDRESERER